MVKVNLLVAFFGAVGSLGEEPEHVSLLQFRASSALDVTVASSCIKQNGKYCYSSDYQCPDGFDYFDPSTIDAADCMAAFQELGLANGQSMSTCGMEDYPPGCFAHGSDGHGPYYNSNPNPANTATHTDVLCVAKVAINQQNDMNDMLGSEYCVQENNDYCYSKDNQCPAGSQYVTGGMAACQAAFDALGLAQDQSISSTTMEDYPPGCFAHGPNGHGPYYNSNPHPSNTATHTDVMCEKNNGVAQQVQNDVNDMLGSEYCVQENNDYCYSKDNQCPAGSQYVTGGMAACQAAFDALGLAQDQAISSTTMEDYPPGCFAHGPNGHGPYYNSNPHPSNTATHTDVMCEKNNGVAPTPQQTPSPATPSPATPSPTPYPTKPPTTTTTTTKVSLEGLDDLEKWNEITDEQEDVYECAKWCYGKKHKHKSWIGKKCMWNACHDCPECN